MATRKRVMSAARKRGGGGISRLSASWFAVQRICAARVAKGWSRKQLASCSGIERADLARLESGEHSPKLRTLKALAKPLGLSAAELVRSAREAAEFHRRNLRSMRAGVAKLKANLKRQRELGIIDERGRRTKRELPEEMLKGTSEAV